MTNTWGLQELKIEVTQKCSLNCLHCSSEANISKTQELSEDLVLRLVEESFQLRVKEITFSGGEPLLWEPLCKILNHCSKFSIESVLYTSGNPIINNKYLCGDLKKANVGKIVISMFGATHATHEAITRIEGSFEKSVTALKEFASWEIPVGIHFVAMSSNWRELEGVVEIANRLHVASVSVLRFVPHGRGAMVSHFNLNKQQLKALRQTIIRLRAHSKAFIRLGSPFNILLLNGDVDCTAACDRLIIGSNGKVYPCDAFKNIDYEGNLSSVIESSLIKVWNGSDYLNEVRKFVLQGLGPECSRCANCSICKGGCLAQKVIRKPGKLTTPDPDCILQEE